GSGCVGSLPVWIAASDPARARGAIGSLEVDALRMLFQAARRSPRPLLLLLDSSGAKVDEGIAGLGAFRRLFREALITRAAGVPMLALLGRSCFGGASLLACLCDARLYSSETLLAVSGPAVIEALSGPSELRAADREQVRALMGGDARSQLGSSELLVADSLGAFRAATVERLRAGKAGAIERDTTAEHDRLGKRTDPGNWPCDDALTDRACKELQSIAPTGYGYHMRGCVTVAEPSLASHGPVLLGVLTGATVGANACWILADELLRMRRSRPDSPIILLLDASGHAATYRDEALMLSAYLAHLGVVIAEAAAGGQRIELRISGAAAGAVYVAFAAAVTRVAAYPAARVRILPEAAVRTIVGKQHDGDVTLDALIGAGVIDAVIDDPPRSGIPLANSEKR
ncbi:MAG TPA: biotin-independent malonate decarboxylase subunit gamma, partial [Burkholderiales bacterium]|nr:biotin-independent malonate decarboxylase subunit gamma [Burkholderiales bacterium]